mmetsp:Transcript_22763/g.35657  ORF Transcript_22763/g.35657 Transcript_22763/m.35657 type:complete len:200 (-) Transcript_22763:66-665(-)
MQQVRSQFRLRVVLHSRESNIFWPGLVADHAGKKVCVQTHLEGLLASHHYSCALGLVLTVLLWHIDLDIANTGHVPRHLTLTARLVILLLFLFWSALFALLCFLNGGPKREQLCPALKNAFFSLFSCGGLNLFQLHDSVALLHRDLLLNVFAFRCLATFSFIPIVLLLRPALCSDTCKGGELGSRSERKRAPARSSGTE